MTEDEWLASNSPHALLWHLRRTQRTTAARRKLRLLACADVRLTYPKLPDDRLAVSLAAAEDFADGGLDKEEARRAAGHVAGTFMHWLKDPVVGRIYQLFDPRISEVLNVYANWGTSGQASDLVREVFGNPFRPVAFDKAWRTSSALALAKTMYDTRDFAAMPILSDALQDAGCEDEPVLAHCRGSSCHVRGCWVVDLVLGKA